MCDENKQQRAEQTEITGREPITAVRLNIPAH